MNFEKNLKQKMLFGNKLYFNKLVSIIRTSITHTIHACNYKIQLANLQLVFKGELSIRKLHYIASKRIQY